MLRSDIVRWRSQRYCFAVIFLATLEVIFYSPPTPAGISLGVAEYHAPSGA